MDKKKGREEEQVTERLIRLEFARSWGGNRCPTMGGRRTKTGGYGNGYVIYNVVKGLARRLREGIR